jgi:hypothetical protein
MHRARRIRTPSSLATWGQGGVPLVAVFALTCVSRAAFGLCTYIPLVSLSVSLGLDVLAPLPP